MASSKVSSSSSWCIFCLRNTIKSDINPMVLAQFLKLFSRYTEGGINSYQYDDFYKKFSLLLPKKGCDDYEACQDCSLLLLDFCDFYEKVKVLEMKLDWKLHTLKSIMRSADKVPMRWKNFREKLEWKENKGLFQEVKDFRRKLVRMASNRLKSAIPRLKLIRCSALPTSEFNEDEKYNVQVSTGLMGINTSNYDGTALSEPSLLLKRLMLSNSDNTTSQDPGKKAFLTENKAPSSPVESMTIPDFEPITVTDEFIASSVEVKVASQVQSNYDHDHDEAISYSSSSHEVNPSIPSVSPVPVPENDTVIGEIEICNLRMKETVSRSSSSPSQLHFIENEEILRNVDNSFHMHDDNDYDCGNQSHNDSKAEFVKDGATFANSQTTLDNQVLRDDSPPNEDIKTLVKTENDAHDDIPKPSSKFMNKGKRARNGRNKLCHLRRRNLKTTFKSDALRTSNLKSKSKFTKRKWVRKIKQEFSLSPYAMEKLCQKEKRICRFGKCKDVFYSDSDLETHSKLHGSFQCFSCKVVMNSVKMLFRHERTCRHDDVEESPSPNLTSCPRCEFTIPFRKNFTPHWKLLTHYLEAHFNLKADYQTCPLCHSKIFNSSRHKKTRLQLHLEQCHNFSAENYKCEEPECHAYFNSKLMLVAHRSSHRIIVATDPSSSSGGTMKFQCSDCRKGFVTKRGLMGHVKKAHNSKSKSDFLPFPCPSEACPREFGSQEEVDKHVNEIGVLICPECGKCYHNLTKHLPTHSAKHKQRRVWACKVCGKQFKASEQLRMHSLSHSGPESWQFACEICGKKIMTKQKLDEHMRTHSKEKPFTCEICGVSYAHRHNLRIHINNKHSDIASDPPKKFDRSRLVSRKGIRLKKTTLPEKGTPERKRKARPPQRARKRRRSASSSGSNAKD